MSSPTSGHSIPIARPWVTEEEEHAVAEVLRSRWLTQGPRVAAFEEAFAAYVGAPHAVAVSSCTTGLQLVFQALGIGAGDEVVCPSLSFIATANSVVHAGATPIFADVDERTHNLTVATAQASLTSRTRAILVAHQIGMPAELDELVHLCCDRGLYLIEDAACAAGSTYRGARIGRPHGMAAVFSFHPRKVLSTGEGGMVTTRDPALAQTLRTLRHHGMAVSDMTRHTATTHYPQESYSAIGYNYRMTDLQAAVGIVQLRKLDEMVARRQEQAATYDRAFSEAEGLITPYVPAERTTSYQSYLVRIVRRPGETLDALRLRRDEVIDALLVEGISTRPSVMAAHRAAPYRAREATLPTPPLPVTELISDSGIVLPLFHELTDQDQLRVSETLLRHAR